MAVPPVRAVELERFERQFNRARIAGAAIAIVLGPLFPHIGIAHVVALSALLVGQAMLAALLLRTRAYHRDPELAARSIFAIDLTIVAYAIFVFAADPGWTTYIVGLLLVIAGGFRFATIGALAATLVMAVTYVLVAIYRDSAFGFGTEPQRLAFTVAIYLLAGFLMAGLVRDLDALRAQREAFEHQRAEAEALRELDRMKSDFLAAMSHDFRSPLTVVRGVFELLLSEGPGDLTKAQRELALRAQRNVRRLEEFTEDLLETARLEHGGIALDQVEVDACALVREVVDDHRPFAEQRSQAIELECGEPTQITADPTRLRRAIGNLLSNAIKYGPEWSAIRVRAGSDGDGGFRVSVTDSGPGVDPSERERIFEKFSRGRRTVRSAGSGLGLAIARSLAELHGGTLVYQDAEGGGATFVLRVPLAGE